MSKICISIEGLRPVDEVFTKMKAVYDACTAANVDVPEEVQEYFGCNPPEERGAPFSLHGHYAVSEYNTDTDEGYEVDLSKLDKSIKILRFYISY